MSIKIRMRAAVPLKQIVCGERTHGLYNTPRLKAEQLKAARMSRTGYEDLLKGLKLIETKPFDGHGQGYEVQLLKNNCVELDYLFVRRLRKQALFYFHRLDLLLQRVQYLSGTGLTPRDKLSLVKRKPPVFIISRNHSFEGSKMLYLRGLMREDSSFSYLFYPVFPRLFAFQYVTENKMNMISQALGVTQERVIQMVVNLPSFSLDPSVWNNDTDDFIWLHKSKMPDKFDLDRHTAHIHPPIYSNCAQLKEKHFSNDHSIDDAMKLPSYSFTDILDHRYPVCDGIGTPEDLREFVTAAYNSELKIYPRWIFKKKKFIAVHVS